MAATAMAGPASASQQPPTSNDNGLASGTAAAAAAGPDKAASEAKLFAQKYKASELPLSSLTRTSIDGLMTNFKKKGGYDAIRKQVWDKFEAGVSHSPYPISFATSWRLPTSAITTYLVPQPLARLD